MRSPRLIVFVLAALIVGSSAGAVESPPNIIFVLADDLGYGDVKCFGEDRCQIATPNFDRLAREGMRFTNAHSTASVCVPSRIAIMTGRYAWRFARPKQSGPWGFINTQLPTDQFTIARLLQSKGYRTGYVGKWHLGTTMQTVDGKNQGPTNVDYSKPLTTGPPQFGFDESFILPGSLDMYPYAYVFNNHWVGNITAQKGWSAFNRVGPAAEDFDDTMVLDTFCREASRFVAAAANRDERFFLYLALTSPHTPLSPRKAFQGKSRLGPYGDFVMETDDCVGRILKTLDEVGVADDTIIIVTSDHGPASYAGRNRVATYAQNKQLQQDGHYSGGIYRGYKFSVYEGAFRVPLVVRWPSTVAAGTTCDRLVSLGDLMATVAEITEHQVEKDQAPDSISFLPLLKNAQADAPRESMIMQATRAMSIRRGKWKLSFCPGSGSDGRWGNLPMREEAWEAALADHGRRIQSREELLDPDFVQLFDLQNDPRENQNVANANPKLIQALHKLYVDDVSRGRSTPGAKLTNQRPDQRAFSGVPDFVWDKNSTPVRVIVWDERQEKQKVAYENYLGNAIASHLRKRPGIAVKSVSLDEAGKGITAALLDECDVLVWWGHVRQSEISPAEAKRIIDRIKNGSLDLIALHSAHWSTPFMEAMNEITRQEARRRYDPLAGRQPIDYDFVAPPGRIPPAENSLVSPAYYAWQRGGKVVKVRVDLPNCCFPAYLGDGKPSTMHVEAQGHPIARGLPAQFQIASTEMYGEPFHVPPPDDVILKETWASGRWFRSGAVWTLGKGKVFYFRPGHETFPVYKEKWPLKVVENAIRWLGQ